MTPKEKATELIDKFYQTTPNEAWYNPPLGSISIEFKAWEQAKQCALIAVDEILNMEILKRGSKLFNRPRFFDQINYWQEVKKEIEAL